MSDAAVESAPPAPAAAEKPAAEKPTKPKKIKTKASKAKKPANHPKYCDMIAAALAALKERGGSSRQAIIKYIMANYNLGKDEKTVNQHLKMSLRAGLKNGALKQAKGTGASGSFRLGEAKKQAAKKKPKAKKPAADKKVKKPKPAAKPKAKKAAKSPSKAKKASPKKAKAADKKKAKSPKPKAIKAPKAKTTKPKVVKKVAKPKTVKAKK